MNNRFRHSSLGQQLAIITAGLCLAVSLALVALGAISTRHMQMLLQEQYGTALARLVAARISTDMERGDLLSVSATLQRLMEISTAQAISATDVDGKVLGQTGETEGQNLYQYSAPVHIESDIAGKIVITINGDDAHAAQLRFLLSMLGLAVLLSLAVYAISRRFGQHLGSELSGMARKIALEAEESRLLPANELLLLGRKIDALPMDLLRTRSEPGPQDENYRTTAVLYLHLSSLVNYVDTLDERALQGYTERLHQVVYAAAGFYAGELQVARQFGLAIYFSDNNSAGSAAFRAASCAWLVRAVSRALEEHMSLSLSIAMAISQSELGVGSGTDIYPGLYTQHTVDELWSAPHLRAEFCIAQPPATRIEALTQFGHSKLWCDTNR